MDKKDIIKIIKNKGLLHKVKNNKIYINTNISNINDFYLVIDDDVIELYSNIFKSEILVGSFNSLKEFENSIDDFN